MTMRNSWLITSTMYGGWLITSTMHGGWLTTSTIYGGWLITSTMYGGWLITSTIYGGWLITSTMYGGWLMTSAVYGGWLITLIMHGGRLITVFVGVCVMCTIYIFSFISSGIKQENFRYSIMTNDSKNSENRINIENIISSNHIHVPTNHVTDANLSQTPHLTGVFPQPERRLNVMFIIADDMRPQLGCYNNQDSVPSTKSIRMFTPNMDALAKRSLVLMRYYTQYSLCGPSRASMLTGIVCGNTIFKMAVN